MFKIKKTRDRIWTETRRDGGRLERCVIERNMLVVQMTDNLFPGANRYFIPSQGIFVTSTACQTNLEDVE